MARALLLISLLSIIIPSSFMLGVLSGTFKFTNKCDHTVWPGILSGNGTAALATTGFTLQKGESKTVTAPSSWSGRLWGRTLCTQDSTGKFSCVTGDCGSNKMECAGGNVAPPATLAEFTLNGAGGLDFYGVSLVDGYNLPMLVVPQGGTGNNCTNTGCVVDLNGKCPSELRVTSVDGTDSVACKSACGAFGEPQYCCRGAYSTPDTCKPSTYSELFKNACPRAHSYAYDDKPRTFTCAASPDYLITFCHPPDTSQKSSTDDEKNQTKTQEPLINSTAVYEGALAVSGTSLSTFTQHVFRLQLIAGAIAVLPVIWQFRQLF